MGYVVMSTGLGEAVKVRTKSGASLRLHTFEPLAR
jgi:hypothetical protein